MQVNSKNTLIIYCGLLCAVGAVSIDILMPVFGNMRTSFGVSMESVQLTIPVYTFFLGISQFFMGTLSDRFGRRIIIIYGMSFYVIGGFIAILYPSIEMVLLGRVIQGIGGGCGQVVARAMLRDTCSGREYSIALARVIAIFALGPIIAPLIGAALNMGDTWRPAFAFMIVFGLGLLAYSVFALTETISSRNFDALKFSAMKGNFLVLLRDKKVLHLLLIGCSAKIALFSYLVNGAPVFEAEFGVVKMNFALLFAFTGLGIIIGQICNTKAIARFGEVPAMRIASYILVFCGLMIFATGYLGYLSALGLCALMTLFNTSFLIVYTNAAALIINRHHTMAGFTSAALGVTTQVVPILIATAFIPFISGSAAAWGLLITVTTGVSLVSLLYYHD